MGTLIQAGYTDTKTQFVVSQAATLASLEATNIGIWVGNSVAKNNQVELRTTLQRCFSQIKEDAQFGTPASGQYKVGSGPLSGARDGVQVKAEDQPGTWAEEGLVALCYGENFDHPPGASHFIDAVFKRLLEVAQERAWAQAT